MEEPIESSGPSSEATSGLNNEDDHAEFVENAF